MKGNHLLKLTRHEILHTIKNLSLIILGTLLLSFGTAIFIIPTSLVTGGVSSIAIILDLILPFEFLNIDILITAITWILFFAGLFILGKSFALKTLLSSIVYPVAISLFLKLCSPSVLNGFFYLQGSEHGELSLIVAAVAGGVCVGAGCALTFIGGGSTGGVDIIAFALCKVFKNVKSSVLMFIIDAGTVILGMFVIGDLVITMLGVFSAFVAALMIDKVFLGDSKAFIAHIITENYEEITARIIHKLDRSATIVSAVGAYSGKEKKMVMVTFKRSQYADLLSIVNSVDKKAFFTIHQAHEINGEGWTR